MNVNSKATITIKTDKTMKMEFAKLCDDVGFSMSSVLNAMMRQAVRKQKLELSTRDVNGMTPSEAAELKRRADEVKAGRVKMYSLIEN